MCVLWIISRHNIANVIIGLIKFTALLFLRSRILSLVYSASHQSLNNTIILSKKNSNPGYRLKKKKKSITGTSSFRSNKTSKEGNLHQVNNTLPMFVQYHAVNFTYVWKPVSQQAKSLIILMWQKNNKFNKNTTPSSMASLMKRKWLQDSLG